MNEMRDRLEKATCQLDTIDKIVTEQRIEIDRLRKGICARNADRQAMAAKFERAYAVRIAQHHGDDKIHPQMLIYGEELKRLVDMIRGDEDAEVLA